LIDQFSGTFLVLVFNKNYPKRLIIKGISQKKDTFQIKIPERGYDFFKI